MDQAGDASESVGAEIPKARQCRQVSQGLLLGAGIQHHEVVVVQLQTSELANHRKVLSESAQCSKVQTADLCVRYDSKVFWFVNLLSDTEQSSQQTSRQSVQGNNKGVSSTFF